jgi:hypothetical protein
MRSDLTCGHLGVCQGGSRTKYLAGVVKRISAADPERWPSSPVKCVEVAWDPELQVGGEYARMSPWELLPQVPGLRVNWGVRPLDPELAQAVVKGIQEVAEMDISALFSEPVDIVEIPDYILLVPLPMDLSLVISRLKKGYYRHPEAVDSDLTLIVENSIIYNGEGTPIPELARKVCRLARKALRRAVQEFKAQSGEGRDELAALESLDEDEEVEVEDEGHEEEHETGRPSRGRREGTPRRLPQRAARGESARRRRLHMDEDSDFSDSDGREAMDVDDDDDDPYARPYRKSRRRREMFHDPLEDQHTQRPRRAGLRQAPVKNYRVFQESSEEDEPKVGGAAHALTSRLSLVRSREESRCGPSDLS